VVSVGPGEKLNIFFKTWKSLVKKNHFSGLPSTLNDRDFDFKIAKGR
jgi:hypothetical protein